ncbi:phosphotransferase family protein [Actinomycetospora sp. NBRC 106378]|uniref:phosphotransferase family protein n=1 Tax=Actinomycetospora sp. NBRC 106378 TaxID=3032208 RepID=UPI0024A1B6CD|nr:phosphotransferase family protein [Actinomycetospora sp. NBRC 106378]GLZ51565.1 aminoglycoside phosphotransferase [Actinomycetospora sp. NBRC 106378]
MTPLAALEAFLHAPGRVVDVRRTGVGRSRQNWLFDLRHDDGSREPLILRSDPDGGLVETDRALEFALLGALVDADLPTPPPHSLDADGTAFGSPSLMMGRLPGTCDYRVLTGDRPEAERVAIAVALCELLARVHATDWKALGLGELFTDPGEQAARHELDRWEGILRRDRLAAHPELELALVALRERAPRSRRTVLVHADFKPGNVLLRGVEITALLDWELAHLGDPLEDLGWVTQPLRAGEHAIPGRWEAADLIGHYEEVTGEPVDREALRWWVTFSTFKTAVMQVSGLRAFLEGRSDEPYRPHRRVLGSLLDDVNRGF